MINPSLANKSLPKTAIPTRIRFGSPAHDSTGIETAEIEKIIKKATTHFPKLQTIAIVEVATGTCLAYAGTRGINPTVAAAQNAEVVRRQSLVMKEFAMRGERLEDILIPFRKQLHLIRLAKNGQWFGYLVVKAQDTSLALAREVLKSIIA
ncbi:hypothetical protein [Hymenobacter negativus]|uniref:Roadblock/LAMTOR2 domain-containing protein n=1 Tax=Hymenobacter negativus TaxID=2795026 RepID=A0ABS3QF49_9BACT|nr:hypothetical protein [Hymenobacter negativus]MBO2009881.1 hypothetical protein [Hymenobacter negativus]